MRVGIRELKNRLSEYVERVKDGAEVTATDRGRPVAVLRATGPAPAVEAVSRWVAEGVVAWRRGKPRGCKRPPRSRGAPAAGVVLEDRR